MHKRPLYNILLRRLQNTRRFIQVLAGPRQTGKTTLARQVAETLDFPCHCISADEPTLKGGRWIEQQWDAARLKLRQSQSRGQTVVMLDEIQKLPGWSETVKRLWDEDTAARRNLQVVILGSAPPLMRQGLTESLAGRFEFHPVPHWSHPEMRDAFGSSLDQYIFFGGYPGAAALNDDPQRWASYLMHNASQAAKRMRAVDEVRLMKKRLSPRPPAFCGPLCKQLLCPFVEYRCGTYNFGERDRQRGHKRCMNIQGAYLFSSEY